MGLGTEYGYAKSGAILEEATLASKTPEKKFKAGGITATVWKSVSPKGVIYHNIQISKSYKDLENNWKTTNSLKEYDVPKAIVLLQKAYEFVIMQQGAALV